MFNNNLFCGEKAAEFWPTLSNQGSPICWPSQQEAGQECWLLPGMEINKQTKYAKVLNESILLPNRLFFSFSSHMTHLQNICSPTTCWSSSSWSSTASSPPPSSSLSSPGLGVQPTLPPSKMRRGKLPLQVLKRNNAILKHKSLVRSRGDPCPAVRCHRHRLHPLLLIGGGRGGCLLGIIVNIHYTRLI